MKQKESSFTLDGITLREHRYLSMNSVLAYLYAFAEQYEAIDEPDAAHALRHAAEQLRAGDRV